MGHHAKCLGLREPPRAFAKEANQPKPERPRNRLTVEEKRERLPKSRPQLKPKTLVMATRGTRVAASGARFSSRSSRDKQFRAVQSFDFDRGLKTAKQLNISEFDSGLPALKRQKKK